MTAIEVKQPMVGACRGTLGVALETDGSCCSLEMEDLEGDPPKWCHFDARNIKTTSF